MRHLERRGVAQRGVEEAVEVGDGLGREGSAATAAGSKWCGATGIVKLSADLTAMSNLK